MRTKMSRTISTIIAVLLVVPLIITGCDISGIGEGVDETFDLIVQLPAVETTFSGQFIDAESGELIDQQDIAITIKGPDRNVVVDPLLFESISTATVEDGFLDMAIQEEVTPTSSAPVHFTVVAEAEGYITNTKSFAVADTGKYRFSLNMVAEQKPPNGVAVTSDQSSGSTDGQGTVTEEQTVTTDAAAGTGGQAAVTLSKGTKVTDAEGTPLQGALSSTVAYYNNQSEEALSSFPGGFDDVTARTASGEEVSGGTFVSGSFASVDIEDAAGRKAHQFSQPVEVAMTVPEGTVNPETGQPVQEGDVVPLWSYNEETGAWVEEGSTTASKRRGVTLARSASSGNLIAEFNAPHLSYWNVGWFMPPDNRCQSGTQFEIQGNDSGADISYKVYGPGYVNSFSSSETSFTVAGFPTSLPWIEAKAYYDGEVVGHDKIEAPCGSSFPFSLDEMPNDENLVTVKLDVSITCDKQEVRPSTDFKYKRAGTQGAWNTATLENGRVTINGLVNGATYKVSVTYNDDGTQKTVTEEVTLDGEPNKDGVIEIDRDFADIDEVCENV